MDNKNEMKSLKKLSRAELLELLIEQSRKIEELTQKLEEKDDRIEKRLSSIEEAGNLAEASLELSGMFESAQAACRIYTENIKKVSANQQMQCEKMEQATREKCEKMIAETREDINLYWQQAITQFDRKMARMHGENGEEKRNEDR